MLAYVFLFVLCFLISFLSVQSSGIKYIHMAVQPSPASISKSIFIFPNRNPLNTNSLIPHPSPWQQLCYFPVVLFYV